MESMIMIVAMLAMLYFFMIRPENKRKKEAQNMRDSLTVGDVITTIGGITLQAPEKFCIRRHTLFITDRVKNGTCVYAIPMSELK